MIAVGFALAALVHGAAVRASRARRLQLVLVYPALAVVAIRAAGLHGRYLVARTVT